jgi:hypothetical protein
MAHVCSLPHRHQATSCASDMLRRRGHGLTIRGCHHVQNACSNKCTQVLNMHHQPMKVLTGSLAVQVHAKNRDRAILQMPKTGALAALQPTAQE